MVLKRKTDWMAIDNEIRMMESSHHKNLVQYLSTYVLSQ